MSVVYNALLVLLATLCLVPGKVWAQDAPWVGETFSGVTCRGSRGSFGPYDYLLRAGLARKLDVVERHHFTPQVENLVRGENAVTVAGDLSYTLLAWPNHHRALNAMIRYQQSLDAGAMRQLAERGIPPVECYLYRAIQFSPNDHTSRMLLGLLLHRNQKSEAAEATYRQALELQPNDLEIQYNLALLLVDKLEFAEARQLAVYVYERKFPLKGLERKLRNAGYWP